MDVEEEVQESFNNLSIAIETAPKENEPNYDHLNSKDREELVMKDI